jgi:hypothetical protein
MKLTSVERIGRSQLIRVLGPLEEGACEQDRVSARPAA